MPTPCSLLSDLRIGFGGGRARLLRFFRCGFSGREDRAGLAPDLRPIGDDPVRRRGRCGCWSAGPLSDKWGRKALIFSGTFICAFGAGAISLIPDGAWLLFAVLRFLIGFGLAGSFAPATTLIVEITPTRHRTVLAGLFIVAPTVGTMIASLTVANLLAQLGWRGVAALGVILAVFGVLVIFVIPESVRWLAVKGR